MPLSRREIRNFLKREHRHALEVFNFLAKTFDANKTITPQELYNMLYQEMEHICVSWNSCKVIDHYFFPIKDGKRVMWCQKFGFPKDGDILVNDGFKYVVNNVGIFGFGVEQINHD